MKMIPEIRSHVVKMPITTLLMKRKVMVVNMRMFAKKLKMLSIKVKSAIVKVYS